MKNQRMKCERRLQPLKLIALLAMFVIIACFSVVLAGAADVDAPTPILDSEALGLTYDDETGYWQKDYDGKTALDASKVTVRLPGVADPVAAQSVTVDNANVGERSLVIEYLWNGETERISLPLRIERKQLTWSETAQGKPVAYNPSTTEYTTDVIFPSTLKLNGFAEGEGVTLQDATVSFAASDITGESTKISAMATVPYTENGTTDMNNYILPPLTVEVEVTPIEIEIDDIWPGYSPSFVYGAAGSNNIYDALEITATAKTADGTTVPLKVLVETASGWKSLAAAYAADEYGNVKREDVSGTTYKLAAVAPNALYKLVGDGITTRTVRITRASYSALMSGATYFTQVDLSDPKEVKPFNYQLLINGEGIPADVLAQVIYTYTDSKGNVVLTGTADTTSGVSIPGSYTVTATLPRLYSGANNEFENYEFDRTEISATLTLKRNFLAVGTKDEPYQMIILGTDGIPDGMDYEFSYPSSIDRKAIYGYHIHKEYTLRLLGGENKAYTLIIPISSSLVSDPNSQMPGVDDIYFYDVAGNMAPVKDSYKVSISENGAYYIIEGYDATAAVTFIIAPAYEAPFWVTAPGIALIILLVLLLLLILFLIGLKLRQIERTEAYAKTHTIDTEGDIPTFEPVVIPDTIEDVDACLDEGIDRMATALRPDVDPEVVEEDYDVNAEDAVAESIQDLKDEADLIDLKAEEAAELAAIDEMTEAMVEEKAADLQETVEPANDTDITDEVNAAVAAAMAENFNESADATEAIALVEEETAEEPVEEPVEEVEEIAVESDDEDDDNDNDNDEDDDDSSSFGGFGSMPLTFIDAVAEAEQYNAMLEQERLGEVQLVTRYRRSYQSRLSQSQGSVQDYYNVIKNLLLSYKGIKNRISWNYESFNLGRRQVAKFNAKTRTLYLYMALDPEELAETKYTFADMSSKKKYAGVPVLMKIKGDRKFKHAVEMITMLCEEKLQLQKKKVVTEEDYKIDYMTTEQLVEAGYVKKLVAAIPLTDVAEEAPAEEPVAEAPATETPVEETETLEEAPAEEAPAEVEAEADVAAVAETDGEETENI